MKARAGRTIRTVWLAFTTLALSLAIPAIPRYFELLRTPCSGTQCFGAQLTLEAAQAWVATGENLLFYASLHVLVSLTIDVLLLSTAAFLVWRKAQNRAAVLAAFVGTALATSTLSQVLAHADPRFWLPAHAILFVQMAGLLPLFCLFPDGHFQPPEMRWVAIAYVLLNVVYLTPNYRAWLAPDTLGHALWLGFMFMSGLIIVATMFYRFQHAVTSMQQEQMRWVMVGIGLAAPVVLLEAPLPLMNIALLPFEATPSGMGHDLIGMFLAIGSITCLLVALVSYEPLDVGLLINRTLVYAALTAFVIGVYVLIVGYLSTVFRSDNVLFSLIAAALVAVLFQPLRDRLQTAVNRLMYGQRDEPYGVISQLGERLQATLAPEAVLPTIVETVAEALKLPYVAIVLTTRATGAEEVVATFGEHGSDSPRLPLVYGGETVGYLLVSPRSGEAALSHADQRLVADLAKQAGPVVHGVRLMMDLQQMASELQRSREHLVLAREEDRRRLRRDLHDELAPSLAGLSLTAGTIKSVARSDPAAVEVLATELHTALRRAVGDIRRLVYDLRPPALDDLGLVAAIQERAAQFSTPADTSSAAEAPLHVRLDLPAPLPPLPAALEVAAYRIVQEALMNVVRHAHASRCQIRIAVVNGSADVVCLELVIVDDGVGIGAARRAGVGLRSMRERAEEVGGTCEVGQVTGGGTRVFVQLPIGTEKKP